MLLEKRQDPMAKISPQQSSVCPASEASRSNASRLRAKVPSRPGRIVPAGRDGLSLATSSVASARRRPAPFVSQAAPSYRIVSAAPAGNPRGHAPADGPTTLTMFSPLGYDSSL